MSKGKLLFIVPDFDLRNMLKIYFAGRGYDVLDYQDSEDVIENILNTKPDAIVFDTDFDKIDQIDFLKRLSSEETLRRIPVILRSDNPPDLSEYYYRSVPKKFDIEELKLYISNSTRHLNRKVNTQPNIISGLPMGSVIEEYLRDLMRREAEWSYIDIKITNFDHFKMGYGWQAGNEVIRATALIISDVIKAHGTEHDFPGHPGNDNFVIISHATDIETMIDTLKKRFDTEIQQHYSFIDRERGFMLIGDDRKELMTLATGSVSTRTHEFADIREVTELAVDDRRGKSGINTSDIDLSDW